MIAKLIVLIVVAAAIWAALEYIVFRLRKDNEVSRKLLHIMHGLSLATASFIIPLKGVAVVEIVFLLMVTVGKYIYAHHLKRIGPLGYLGKLYKVGRLSYGEFFFPVSVMMAAFLADSHWEFAAAMLVLGLADAAAALVGKRYGHGNSYVLLGQKKSLAGSAAFYVVAVLVVLGFVVIAPGISVATGLLALIWLPLLLTATENLGVYGSDNLLIPLVAVIALNTL